VTQNAAGDEYAAFAPSVSARLPATVPSIAQNMSMAARLVGQVPSIRPG